MIVAGSEPMKKYPGIPELLEQYMKENGTEERWITVNELCDRFSLTRHQCNTVSGFLRRLVAGPYGQFPNIVLKIELTAGKNPSDPKKCRYLVKRKVKKVGTVTKTASQKNQDSAPCPVYQDRRELLPQSCPWNITPSRCLSPEVHLALVHRCIQHFQTFDDTIIIFGIA